MLWPTCPSHSAITVCPQVHRRGVPNIVRRDGTSGKLQVFPCGVLDAPARGAASVRSATTVDPTCSERGSQSRHSWRAGAPMAEELRPLTSTAACNAAYCLCRGGAPPATRRERRCQGAGRLPPRRAPRGIEHRKHRPVPLSGGPPGGGAGIAKPIAAARHSTSFPKRSRHGKAGPMLQ